MRTTWLFLFLLACSAAPRVAPENPSRNAAPDPAVAIADCPEQREATLSVAAALQLSQNQSVLVQATLCEDRTKIPCPPCPQGADCAQCLPPEWLFCDAPPIVDYLEVLAVSALPGVELVVGRRYVVSGDRLDARGLRARSICELSSPRSTANATGQRPRSVSAPGGDTRRQSQSAAVHRRSSSPSCAA